MPSRAEEACMETKSSATCPCQPPLVLPKTTRVGPGRSQVIQGIWGVRGRDLGGVRTLWGLVGVGIFSLG